METKKKISKAQLKRNKDFKDKIDILLKRELFEFKNDFLQKYLDSTLENLENRLKLEKESLEFNLSNTKLKDSNLKYSIKRIESELENKAITSFSALTEANENYNSKVEALAMKIFKSKISEKDLWKLSIERVRNVGIGFEFLISDEITTLHARVIYANGEQNVAHFRFITTERKGNC